jgi:Domain of unknown function (DUF1772)
MLIRLVDFFSLLAAALVVGSMFGLWLGLNPSALPAPVYVAQHQQLVRGLNVALPAMGAAAAAFTLAAAYFARQQPGRLVLLLVGAAGLIGAGLITRIFNQPINAIVMTWSAESPPANWVGLRDTWWSWHVARTCAGLLGLCSVIAATLWRN